MAPLLNNSVENINILIYSIPNSNLLGMTKYDSHVSKLSGVWYCSWKHLMMQISRSSTQMPSNHISK